MKINPRQKWGDAVACASFAPMPLHRPIRHAGLNKQLIIVRQRKNGGGRSYYIIGIWAQLATSPVLGIIFRSAGRHPKKYFLKATARPQILFCEKLQETKNNYDCVTFW
jgi:hypothetical protein